MGRKTRHDTNILQKNNYTTFSFKYEIILKQFMFLFYLLTMSHLYNTKKILENLNIQWALMAFCNWKYILIDNIKQIECF